MCAYFQKFSKSFNDSIINFRHSVSYCLVKNDDWNVCECCWWKTVNEELWYYLSVSLMYAYIHELSLGSEWWTFMYYVWIFKCKEKTFWGVRAGENSWMSDSQNSWMIHKIHEWFTKMNWFMNAFMNDSQNIYFWWMHSWMVHRKKFWWTYVNNVHEQSVNMQHWKNLKKVQPLCQ